MSDLEIQQVIAQMRNIRAQIEGPTAVGEVPENGEFAKLLASGIESVNNEQKRSSELKEAFATGKPGVELVEVMLQSQKSKLSFQAMTEVRNHLVKAYQDIMNMPL